MKHRKGTGEIFLRLVAAAITLNFTGSELLAASTDAPWVSIEGTAIVQDASGVFVSPLDNPAVRVEMPLNTYTVSVPGYPSQTGGEEVGLNRQGASLKSFLAQVQSTCSPSDLLCLPVVTESPFHELWPIPVLDTAQVLQTIYTLNAASGGVPNTVSLVNGRTPLVARSLNIGPSVSTVTVTKTGADSVVTSGSAQVRLDPEVIVVPVDAIFVVPDPRTVVSGPAEADELLSEMFFMEAMFGVTGVVSGGNVVTAGGENFAQALFDSVSLNQVSVGSHPAGQVPTGQQASFRYRTSAYSDSRQRELLSTGLFEPPDPIWAQCGVQFRLRSVKRVVEADSKILHLATNGFASNSAFCGSNSTNAARLQEGAARWLALAGIDPALPGFPIYFVPRISEVESSQSVACSTLGLANDGFAFIPANPNGAQQKATLFHELGHVLGLDDLTLDAYCFNGAGGSVDDSNVMCNFGTQTGHHLSGCDVWRQDGTPGHNCVMPASEAGALRISRDDMVCATAREKALSLSGVQATTPVSCPAPMFTADMSTPGMIDPTGMTDLAAYGGRNLRINDRARLLARTSTYDNGPFATGATIGATRIGVEAKLNTLVTKGPTAQFTHRYTIQSIRAGNDVVVTAQDGRDLNPITVRGAELPLLDVDADFPTAKFADVVLEPNQVFPPVAGTILTPGQYVGRVTLKRGSVLRLGAGRYFMDSLDVQTDGVLEIDHRAGHVEVYVRNSLTFSGKFRNLGGDPYANLFVYSGTGTAQILSAFSGRVIASRGSINLQNFVHEGAFYAAQTLELHQGGAIRYRPLVCNL
jgi:hypothetical protein